MAHKTGLIWLGRVSEFAFYPGLGCKALLQCGVAPVHRKSPREVVRSLYAPAAEEPQQPIRPREHNPAPLVSGNRTHLRICGERHILSCTLPTKVYHTIARQVGPTHQPALGRPYSRNLAAKPGLDGLDGKSTCICTTPAADRSAATHAVPCLNAFRSGLVSWVNLPRRA